MHSTITDYRRLAALAETGLMGTVSDGEFDRLARIASRALGTEVSLLSLVDDTRQCFLGATGLSGDLETKRETPLSHSFCQHVVVSGDVLLIEDAESHPLVKDNPATSEMGVKSYAGVPVVLPDGSVLGSFCSIDTVSRKWSDEDVEVLEDLSKVAVELIRNHTRIEVESAANDEITEGRNRLKQILDSTGEGIYGIDARGICTFVNRKCVQLLAFDDSSELLEKSMHDLIHHTHANGETYPLEECRIFRAIEMNVGVHCDTEVYWTKDGRQFPVEYRSYPVVDGGPTRAVVTFNDISDRLRHQQQLQEALDSAVRANRQKTRFLANMSHEIRTPMNAILGFGELLEETVKEPKARGYISAIRTSGESLLNLINDILDLSKIESGKLELRPGPISVVGMVESVRLLFAQQAVELNLDFDAQVNPECPDFLVLDDLRVRQLLINLVSNALKFTKNGEVAVNVSAIKEPLDAEKVTLVISVADTGVGIAPDEQKGIFLPFRQVEGSDSLSGTGLGLSICRRLASLMGGKISVESEPGEGSTFWIRLPGVRVAKGAGESVPAVSAKVDFNLLKAARILVVDDNQFNRELAAGYLDGSHHEVAEARNGLEGLEKVREWRPDLVLMDIRMPVMDGKEAREKIKADPELKEVPVLAVTASSLLHHTHELRRDFDGYMRKPFSRTQLFNALAKVIPALEEAVVEEALATGESTGGTEVDRSLWAPLIGRMREWEKNEVAAMADSMVIGEVAEFAEDLAQAANDAACGSVATYAGNLSAQASLFEVSKLEATLRGFGVLIDQLEQSLENEPPQ